MLKLSKIIKINDKLTLLLQDTPKQKKSNRNVPIPKYILSELDNINPTKIIQNLKLVICIMIII